MEKTYILVVSKFQERPDHCREFKLGQHMHNVENIKI